MKPTPVFSSSRVLNVYERVQSRMTDSKDSPCKTDKLNSSETKDQSNKKENSKEELRSFCQLQEQITQMKNRINFIEISKNKNKGKLETTARKTTSFLQARTSAQEMGKKLEDRRKFDEQQSKELKEKVFLFNQKTHQTLLQQKEKLRLEKLKLCEKTKNEKKEIRQKLKSIEDEKNEYKLKNTKQANAGKSTASLAKFEGLCKEDSFTKKILSNSNSAFRLHKFATVKSHNVYEHAQALNFLPVEELKTTLDNLVKEEARKIDELQSILQKQQLASAKLKEITKHKK